MQSLQCFLFHFNMVLSAASEFVDLPKGESSPFDHMPRMRTPSSWPLWFQCLIQFLLSHLCGPGTQGRQ